MEAANEAGCFALGRLYLLCITGIVLLVEH